MMVGPATAAASYEYEGKTYYFCAVGCKVAFEKNPEGYLGYEPVDHTHHSHHRRPMEQ